MPVMFKCKTCGTEHESPLGWNTIARFDAVPPEKVVGDFSCPLTRRSENETYTKADLRWHSDYEHANWEELTKLLVGVEKAFNHKIIGSAKQWSEIELEMEARKFQVVASFPDKKIVWDKFRTKEKCEEYVTRIGLVVGRLYVHDGVSYDVVIEPV